MNRDGLFLATFTLLGACGGPKTEELIKAAERAELIFEGEVLSVGESPGFETGSIILATQPVIYKVLSVLKCEYKGSTFKVDHLIFGGGGPIERHRDEGTLGLREDVVKPGARFILLTSYLKVEKVNINIIQPIPLDKSTARKMRKAVARIKNDMRGCAVREKREREELIGAVKEAEIIFEGEVTSVGKPPTDKPGTYLLTQPVIYTVLSILKGEHKGSNLKVHHVILGRGGRMEHHRDEGKLGLREDVVKPGARFILFTRYFKDKKVNANVIEPIPLDKATTRKIRGFISQLESEQ